LLIKKMCTRNGALIKNFHHDTTTKNKSNVGQRKKGDLGQRDYTLKIILILYCSCFNSLLLNQIQPEIEKILRKNLNGFRKIEHLFVKL